MSSAKEKKTMAESPKNILLVEDESGHVELIRRAFEGSTDRFSLTAAATVSEARQRISQNRPDLIITDFLLPDGRGLDVIESGLGVTPVVVMTSHGNEYVAVEMIKRGALDYVVKSPQTFAEMPHVVDRALREWDNVMERKKAEAAFRAIVSATVGVTGQECFDRAAFNLAQYLKADIVVIGEIVDNSMVRGLSVLMDGRIVCDFTYILHETPFERSIQEGYTIIPDGVQEHFPNDKELAGLGAQGYVGMSLRAADGSILGVLGCLTRSRMYVPETAQPLLSVISARISSEIEAVQAEREHERLETQLRQAQKMEAVGQLAGGVAHDFNNILQAVVGYGELALLQVESNEQLRAHLKEVLSAAERGRTLVRQLLAFSRRETLQPRLIHLNDLISGIMKMLRPLIGEHVELKIVPGNGLKTIYADPGQIEQILINLCVNSRDAMPEGGMLTVGTEHACLDSEYCKLHPEARERDYVVLFVSDTGIGMTPEVQEHIFEPFFTTKGVGKGTGLGLATVYGIVKQHDGFITVDGHPERGTTFRIYIPMALTPPKEAETAGIPIIVHGGSETILLAEDEQAVRTLIVKLLENAGYRVIVASDGEEAIRAFSEDPSKFDMALLDIVMPKKGGRSVRDFIRKVRPRFPIIFFSGYSHSYLGSDFQPDDITHLALKPLSPKELLLAIRKLLE